jgi:hypothetical protein
MKKQITFLGFCTLMLTLFAFTQASAQNEKGKGKKEHQKESHSKGKPGKGNPGNDKDRDDHQQEKEYKDNNTNGMNAKNKKEAHKSKDWSKAEGIDKYNWNQETFKERNKIKNSSKVTLCHKFKGDGEPGVSLTVSSQALQAHLNHGDVRGECPANTTTRFSNGFLGKRTTYYNNVQNTQEQVVYSKSVLAYALERLSNSRQQLVVMQSNNTPVQAIEQKKATVLELEQNVSLLETLIDVAVTVVANKLQ